MIGCGWACRFLLHGWDVALYDKDPDADVRISKMLHRARAALTQIYDNALPDEGTMTIASSIDEAVKSAHWVQESLPESLDLKRSIYAGIESNLTPATPLASSTSGFKPSDLTAGLDCASQFVVSHPFNPVYLLPAVELVPSALATEDFKNQCAATLRALGMYPVVINTEIDAHIADRLMEALWREALWLVADGVATTQQIDEVMRHGFGLRWAQMGLFETYRIGGGEAGMRHFLAQFGPALAWPWSRLTDVPDLDAALIEKIACQSDEQSGHLSVTELETKRDANLVAILDALKKTNSGAGAHINDYLLKRGSRT